MGGGLIIGVALSRHDAGNLIWSMGDRGPVPSSTHFSTYVTRRIFARISSRRYLSFFPPTYILDHTQPLVPLLRTLFRQLQTPSNAIPRTSRLLQRQQRRKKKLKNQVDKSIITPRYTRRHFEELNHNILAFTRTAQKNNKFERGRELERDRVDQQWTRLIQRLYPADDPKSYELLAQVIIQLGYAPVESKY